MHEPSEAAGPLERPADRLSPERILTLVTLALVPILILALLWAGRNAVFLLIASILFAAVLDAAARALSDRTSLGRGWALGLVIGGLLALIIAAVVGGGAFLLGQVGALADALRQEALRLGELIDSVQPGRQGAPDPDTVGEVFSDIRAFLWGDDAGGSASFLGAALGAMANAFVIFFIGIFLALDPGLYARGITRLFPPDRRATVADALDHAGDTLQRWLLGQLISMSAIGLMTLTGLLIMGYPLAIPLALLAALLAFVPNLGPLLTYVPIVLAGLPEGFGTVAVGVAVYAVAQAVESYVLTPLVQKRMVSLPPALILFAQVLGGLVFGVWGVALATPIVAVARVWIERYYVRAGLEDAPPDG